MLIEGKKQNMLETTQGSDKGEESIYYVRNKPVMRSALDVLEKLGKNNTVKLIAKGNSIPNAVAIANILKEKMLKDNCKVEKIVVDSENTNGMGRMLSTIEIILNRTS